jgi:cytochrome c-type biogenesis protein CcmH/NrfG
MTAERRRILLAAGWLLLAPLVVYAPLRSAGFVWDDDQYVTENRQLRDVAGLGRIWLDPRSTPQYYPLVHTSYWIEHRLWGLDARGYHLGNVLLHGVAAILLWRVLVRLRVPGAIFAASLFAVHPVMTESVAWITERKNVLSLAFALASLAAYLRFAPLEGDARTDGRAWGRYATSLALFVCALLSKTVVCTLPGVILVLTWWKRGAIRARDLAPLLPFFVLGAAAGLHTAWLEQHHVGALGTEWSLAPLERVLLAGRALWFYAAKLVWPHPLIFFYPRWRIDAADAWQFAFPLAIAAIVAGLWGVRGRIGRGPLAVVLLFAGILFPALGFFDVYPFRYSYVADHFQYHASPVLLASFAAVCAGAAARRGGSARQAARAAAALLIAGLGALTFVQAQVYRDLETLYRDTIAKNAGAWNAYLNLANHYSSTGRNPEALPLAREAVRLAPTVADAHNTLGAVLFLTASEQGPGASAALAEAVTAFSRALALDPTHVDALYNGAVALSAMGRHEEAAALYARMLELTPSDVDARVGRARALLALGRSEEAEADLREVARRAPGRADVQQALARIAARRSGGADPPLGP